MEQHTQPTILIKNKAARDQVKSSFQQLRVVLHNNCPDLDIKNFAIKLLEESESYALRAVHVKKDE